MLRGENRAVVLLFGFGNHSLESALPLFLSPSFSVTHALGVFRTFSLCAALLHVTELSHGAAENRHIDKCVVWCTVTLT